MERTSPLAEGGRDGGPVDPRPPRARPLAPIVAALVALVVAVATRERAPDPPSGPASFWVADRGGGALVGLDDDLFPVRRIAWPWPLRLAPRASGGLWVVSAVAGDPRGPHRVTAVDRDGRSVGQVAVPPVVDVAPLGDRLLVVVDEPAARALIEVRATFRCRARPLAFDPTCCAVAGDRWLVGGADGSLHAFVPEAGLELRARLGRRIVDVEPRPGSTSSWVLDAGPPARLMLVGAGLDVLGSIEIEPGWRTLVPAPDGDRVWLTSREGRIARARIDPQAGAGGAVELVVDSELVRLGRGATDGASLVVTSPGAALRLEANGRRAPGQGGFGFAVDVVAAPPARRLDAPFSSP